MSMWLNYAKVSPATLENLCTKPDLVEALFFDSEVLPPKDFDKKTDVFGEDYRTIGAVMEGMAEAGIEADILKQVTGDGAGAEVAYDFCYGPGFCFQPTEVVALAKALANDPDPFGICEFFGAAAKEGKGIIGGIS